MSIAITPHLNFRGTARAALERYGAVFGGDVTIATHAQVYGTDGAEADNVAHSVSSTGYADFIASREAANSSGKAGSSTPSSRIERTVRRMRRRRM